MTTAVIDAAGVKDRNATLVAVRTLNPRAVWTRSKIRALQALRNVRTQAAARQAAIAQFVKPYWEKIPSGLPGFALLASMAHTPSYRWIMRRVQSGTSLVGRILNTGVRWSFQATSWVARRAADLLGFIAPETGMKLHQRISRAQFWALDQYAKVSDAVANAHRDFFEAATNDAAGVTMRKLATPMAFAIGANLVTQGLLAALISSVPVVGLPLAAAISTSRGMVAAAGTIAAISLYDGFKHLRTDRAVSGPAAAAGVAAPVVPSTPAAPAEAEAEVETREVLLGDETVVIEVVGASKLTPEEAEALAIQHQARMEADEEKQLEELERETGIRPQRAQGRGKRGRPTPARPVTAVQNQG